MPPEASFGDAARPLATGEAAAAAAAAAVAAASPFCAGGGSVSACAPVWGLGGKGGESCACPQLRGGARGGTGSGRGKRAASARGDGGCRLECPCVGRRTWRGDNGGLRAWLRAGEGVLAADGISKITLKVEVFHRRLRSHLFYTFQVISQCRTRAHQGLLSPRIIPSPFP